MANGMFLDNPNYREYVRLLKELHLLEMKGQGDTEAAEALLETMDSFGRNLSPSEIDQINLLSRTDPAHEEGKEVFRSAPAVERSREWLEPQLQEAMKREDWWRVLELLRNGPDFLAPDQVANLRGQAYNALGHPDIALLFYEYAAGQAPQNPVYPVSVRETLQQLGRKAEAIK